MKLDRINEYVLATSVVVVGVVLAITSGRLAGTGDNFWLYAGAALIIYAVTCLTMRMRVWMLIPMFWICSGQLNSMPFHFPFRDMVIMGVVAFFLTLKAFKAIRVRPVYSWLDMVMALNLLYILSVYIRFPIGVHALGTETVGGRAYLEVIFALSGYWVLNQVIMTPKQAKIFPLLLCAVSAAQAAVKTFTFLFPNTAPILGKLYSGVDQESYQAEQSGADEDTGEGRVVFLADVGVNTINLMSSYFSPLTFINPIYIWRFLATIVAVYFCLKSGHRITIPAVAATLFLSTFFRKGITAAVILMLISIPPLVLVVAGQGRLYELPESAQRTLSFIPFGNWDPEVVLNAQGSTDWRLQMWDTMMNGDEYIQNKMFGDGFGFTKEELESMHENGSQADFMTVNDPHSGPISTIRVGGYIGLGLFLLLLLGCSIRAWRLIRATKGSPFYPVSLFIGIQVIYGAFGFVVIYGDFKSALPGMVESVGLLNLLSNGFAAYRKSIEQPAPAPIPKKTIQPIAPIPIPLPALH